MPYFAWRHRPTRPGRAERAIFWHLPPWAAILAWLLLALARLLIRAVRAWRITAPAAGICVVWAWVGLRGLLLLLAVLGATVGLWWRLRPSSTQRRLLAPVRNRLRLTRYRSRWAHVMTALGLGVRLGGVLTVPRLDTVEGGRDCDRLRVVLVGGQLVDDLAAETDRLAEAFGAHHVTVAPGARFGEAVLTLWHRDPLAPVVAPASVPAALDLTALPVGVRDDGEPFLLRLAGTHILVAGSTGAGKGSVIWSVVNALAGGVRAGLVNLWAIDPKGGMELGAGAALFTRFAHDSAEQIAGVLEDAVTLVRARASRMRGTARLHTPTPAAPLVVIVIDELAAITAYLTDRTVRERIRAALGVVLTLGRAVGVHVLAALQDPRKEILSYRNLFPTRIALRLAEGGEVDLVLGDGARNRGAVCDRIPHTTPGVGYVVEDGSPMPVRVRFAYLTDTDITALADMYAAPDNVTGLRHTAVDTPGGER
jgi:S-DNA-T family DNA segregation ATPase FtsK/SpoIIIE